MPLHSLVGWIAAALSIAVSWPQAWRSCVKNHTAGLSPAGIWLTATLCIGWLIYGLLLHDPVQIVTNGSALLANTAIVIALLRHQPHARTLRSLLVSGWSSAVLLTCATVTCVLAATSTLTAKQAGAMFGTLISVIGVLAYSPQIVALLRHRVQDVAGISLPRYGLAVAGQMAFCTYGLLVGQPVVWGASLFGVTSNAVVVALTLSRRRNHAQALAQPQVGVPTLPDSRAA